MKKCCKNCKNLGPIEQYGRLLDQIVCDLHNIYIWSKSTEILGCEEYKQKKDKFELAAEEIWDLENCTRPVRGQFIPLVSDILKRHLGEEE